MIVGAFHNGSGLGNQLHRYVATRVLALDKGYKWDMVYSPGDSLKETGFKGKSFMNIEWPNTINIYETLDMKHFHEKKVVEDGVDIRAYDPEFNFIQDETYIEGEFQDERYWQHREDEVNEWLKVEPIDIPDDVCVIGFRGGEFSVFPELFLSIDYWNKAIDMMLEMNPKMKFQVHTDDPAMAQVFFPNYEIIHNIGINWRSMRYAKHAIIANSSFYILPRWLRNGITIAPRYWARHNTKVWALPQNYYSRFKYI